MYGSKLKSVFSDAFCKKSQTGAIENKIGRMVENGVSPFQIIEMLCTSLNETNDQLSKLIINGPQPQIIVTTQEHYDKLVSEKQITNG